MSNTFDDIKQRLAKWWQALLEPPAGRETDETLKEESGVKIETETVHITVENDGE